MDPYSHRPPSEGRWERVLPHRGRPLRLARARLPVPDDAEDVVQEALLRCATFDGLDEERLGELLTAVTVRLCVDERRRRARASAWSRRLPPDLAEPGVDEPVCERAEAERAARGADAPPMQQLVIADRGRAVLRRHRAPAVRVERIEAAPDGARRAAAPEATRGIAGAAAAPLPRPRPVAARRPAPPRRAIVPRVRPPAEPPCDMVLALPGGGGVGHRHDDYTAAERLGHCVAHGVAPRPTIRCRYPDEPAETEPR